MSPSAQGLSLRLLRPTLPGAALLPRGPFLPTCLPSERPGWPSPDPRTQGLAWGWGCGHPELPLPSRSPANLPQCPVRTGRALHTDGSPTWGA